MKSITTFVLALTGICICSVFNLHAQFSGGGTGRAADPFKIKTAADLNNVRNYVGTGNADKHFRLMNDIDLTTFLQSSTEGWLPIGDNNNRFTGYFHGGGHTVSGLWIDRSNTDDIGLFSVNQGTIDSLGVDIYGASINGTYLGGVYGNNFVGGLVGYNCLGSKINECHTTGGITSSSVSASKAYTGGLIGYNDGGSITNCFATNNSSAFGNYYSAVYSGGLIGYNAGTVSNCYAKGKSNVGLACIYGQYSGGFVGYNTGTISNCYATGDISSYSAIISSVPKITTNFGGFVGQNEGTITDCYATGNVPGNNYSTGSWYSYSAGGFVGYLSAGRISNCYAVGQVTSNGSPGSFTAFAGYCGNANYLSQCYYNSEINGSMKGVGNNTGSANVFGKNTTDMKSKATFVNWNFSTIWAIKEGNSYPYFQWQDATSQTGIQFVQKDGNTMIVFPNPATDNITLSGLQSNETLRLYNLNGQLMLTRKAAGETETIAIGHLPAGIYFVKTEMRQALKFLKK